MIAAAAVFAAAIVGLPGGMAQSSPLPERVRQPTPAKVVAEHMAAFNACDWKRLMAQFPDNVEFFAPNGVTVRGRQSGRRNVCQNREATSPRGNLRIESRH